MKRLAAVTVLIVLAGCGGSSDADQVRALTYRMVEATLSSHPERACQYMVDRSGCVGGVVAAHAIGLDVGAAAGYPDDWRKRLARAKITVNGDRATVSSIVDGGHPVRYVRRDGHWLADNR
jgi:hypothetical protein